MHVKVQMRLTTGESLARSRLTINTKCQPLGLQTVTFRIITPVAGKLPNAWGSITCWATVWVWVEDAWHSRFDGVPMDGSARLLEDSMTKVVHGRSWGNSSVPYLCGNSARFNTAPTNAYPEFGFRVSLPLKDMTP